MSGGDIAGATGRRVVLWRHGRTRYNLEERFQGQLDTPLDETGAEQAAAGARLLSWLHPARLVTSDLARASQTAAALQRLCGLSAIEDSRLREHDVGQWANLTRDQVAARFPAAYGAWRTGACPSDWEQPRDLARRALAGVTTALRDLAEGETLIVVSHGGTIRAVVGSLLGFDAEEWWRLGALDNAHWAVLEETTRGWALAEYNVGAQRVRDAPPPHRPVSYAPADDDSGDNLAISAHLDQRRSHA
jgi:probable phosphoglycerate mutase